MRSTTAPSLRFILLAQLCCNLVTFSQTGNLTGVDIGGSTPAGTTQSVPNGYNLRSAGRDIGGTADQFHFGYQQRTGDFDVQVRIENVTITDAFVQAGLLVRDALDPGSRFAGVFSSSAQVGAFFEYRGTASSASQPIAVPSGFPANYPEMYLRLRRAGNTFTGYGSFDGESWQQLGTATLALPSSVFFGLGVASQNTNKVALAEFRDFGNVVAPGSGNYRRIKEPLGPSNRRTGLVFSEIMYNPAPRLDTNNLEFIEIYNGEGIFVDLTGWRINGGIEYEFPAGFRLEAGEFAIVAADPALIESIYGLNGILGPFRGRMNNAGDTIRLLNGSDAIRLETSYEPDAPWPAAADGGGHSLVLARPSYGEDDPRAWSASELIGGSPGQVDAVWPDSLKSIVINEFLAHTDDPVVDFIELYNASNVSVDISGCILTDDITTNRFRIANGTILGPREFIAFNQTQIGFALSAAGETIYLLDPPVNRILDGVRFDGQENGVSSGRSPDGSPEIRRLASTTPGNPNAGWRSEEVVINELMYHPISADNAEQYVEIHNRSGAMVDLSGWRFTDGIDFEFPEGARISAGGFAIVAKDPVRMLANYPQLSTNNTFGSFDGQLSRSGERVVLGKRDFVTETNNLNVVITNAIHIAVNEVTYHDGGRWPELADGGGSSLELIDARADTSRPSNWAASDETQKAPWTSVEVTARLEMGSGAYSANRFQIAMLGAGECLVDDIEMVPSGSTNILVNGNFEVATNSWVFFGNHSLSAIESSGAFAGQRVLHVRAPGDGDTANNSIRGNMVRAITSGLATIRAKVRWLSGWPEVLMRVRGNWIELPARMDVPKNLGTPGLANSRRLQNNGPAIFDVTHTPALPRANEAVVVTCRVVDPDGVAAPRLIYRVDPNATVSTVTMRDDGTGGDALAGDGLFSGTITGRSSGTLVAFRISASDDSVTSATSVFPPNAPAGECLIRWEDTVPFGSFAHYHLWSTAATESARAASRDLDNTYRDATLVYGNFRPIYNVGFRDKGSPYHGGSGDFAVTVPKNELLLGIDDRVFASSGNGGSEGTGMKTDVSGWVGQQLGIPYLHSHFMRLYRNGSRYRDIMLDHEQPNRYYAQSWFGGGGVKDDLFKIAIWFEFDDANSSFNSTGATLQRFLSSGEFKLSRYRWNWQIRPGTDTANDYSSVFNLAAAANSSVERTRTLPLLADMEEWMRVFAYHRILGNWDSYSYQVGQNMYLYAPLGQRASLLPWDIDFVLGEGNAPGTALFTAGQDGVIQTLFNVPMYRRMLWRAYQDGINGALLPKNFQPQVDARRAAFLKNGLSLASPSGITSFMNNTRNTISNQLARADAPRLEITTNAGADFTSTDPTVTITGFAPVAVASIEVNGVPFPINWTALTNWQISVPLGGQTNVLQFAGKDLRGNLVSNATDTITVEYTGAIPQPDDWVVINEIMYNPVVADAEFIELHNRHPSFAFDLSGFQMGGVDFTISAGSFIQPNGYLVLVQNRAVFGLVYDPLLPVVGPYNGTLQRNGESLRLIKPGPTPSENVVIDEVRYENLPPWPLLADGQGPSLQLIDPAQDNSRAANWASTAVNDPNRTTPGRENAIRTLLEPYPEVWLNEIQPVNVGGPADNVGDRDPWIELHNTGTTSIDLAGLSLSDDPEVPGKWQFPPGARILPGEFLLVWLDGEPNESTATDLHTSFRVSGTNGLLVLSRPQGTGSAAMDYLRYLITSPGNTFGSFPDGDARRRRMLYVPTPRSANNATIPNVRVVINEWMADDHFVVSDPADGQFEDWFELYNDGTNTVDLSGFFLSDSRSDPLFQIPAGYQIGPKSFRLIWADSEPTQNAAGRDLHVSFSLRAAGEEIALFTPDEQLVDAVVFGSQSENISEGRYPDGGGEPFALFLNPSPGAPNTAQFANRPPVITQIPDSAMDEGTTYSATVVASDPDQPPQQLTYSPVNPPDGITINTNSGQITWPTTEVHGPGVYTIAVRVTDNGSPQRAATMSFRVTVRELNQAPTLAAISNVAIDEGVELIIQSQAADGDFPAQAIIYSLDAGSPSGAQIDPDSGEFSWTPSEEQGPGNYMITIRATDSGDPAASAARTFQATVRDINNPPVIAEISAQSVNEGSLFSYQVVANDPEASPAQFAYTIESGPAGMTIHATTGIISWTPDEVAGPRDYSVVVRVSEPGGTPSATASFVIGVREVNRPPLLEPIADMIVRPGDRISYTNRVSDPDLPAQALIFSAAGLPTGAFLEPNSGILIWNVPADPVAGTNRVNIRVTDDGTPAEIAQTSFNLIVEVAPAVVINEVMHRPSAANTEFVEIANTSLANSTDISGWRLEGYNYTFPGNTILPPNSFLCVVRSLTAFRTAHGDEPRAYGEAVIALPVDGGILRLIKPAGGGQPEKVIDEVQFSLSSPWPAAAMTGASLQLIDAWEDNQRVSNWSASAGAVTNATTTIVPINGSWRYFQNGAPSSTWNTSAFSDASWLVGNALHYVEESSLPATKLTALTLGQMAYYFRARFNFDGAVKDAVLHLNPVIDDGAIFYLNGEEVFRLGMPEEPVDLNTAASRTVGNAVYEGPFDLPATGLHQGENVFAVEVHQVNSTSSDIVFGTEVKLTTTTPVSFTPGAPNSVSRDLPTMPPVWINEVHPINTTGITDSAGQHDPWLELYNAAEVEVNLTGWSLSDDVNSLAKYDFPANTTIPARGVLLVWADASPNAPGEIHANFRLSSAGGIVVLSARQNATPVIADHVQYSAELNRSFGAERDGQAVGRKLLSYASPGLLNGLEGVRPIIQSDRLPDGAMRISWAGIPGATYSLQATPSLAAPQWQNIQDFTGTGATLFFTNAVPQNLETRFLRLRVN